jgi:hypothetical protein
MRKQADALKVCPIPDACLLVMAQRPYRLLGSPETRSLIFLKIHLIRWKVTWITYNPHLIPGVIRAFLSTDGDEWDLLPGCAQLIRHGVLPFILEEGMTATSLLFLGSSWYHDVLLLT